MKWLRCFLATDDREIEVTVDVMVDQNLRVIPGLSYYGMMREGGEPYPLVCLPLKDEVDFGDALTGTGARYAHIGLHGRLLSDTTPIEYQFRSSRYDLRVLRRLDLADDMSRGRQVE